ncbi:MAG: methylenetetrahydrofolate reductase C-terminal domain-containing protein [Eubacteriaceae bacterium]|nr:methylenetetrahydrofolate reductase C-terminal domain-containing protein [Eubacteriaceae bacterium]
MIITTKKPVEELLNDLRDAKNVLLVGCGECATVCKTGGEADVEEMRAILEANGKTIAGSFVSETCCNALLVKKELKNAKDALGAADAIVSLSCGDGTQTLGDQVEIPVYPANNTMFLGEVVRQGIFKEACRFCGDCVLANTGAICPVTQCAKSLANGPCGGSKEGHCEVNPETPCAWIEIYEKVKKLGQVDRLAALSTKAHGENVFPRTINLKDGTAKV